MAKENTGIFEVRISSNARADRILPLAMDENFKDDIQEYPETFFDLFPAAAT